jgi:hypothetical protein
MTMKHVPAATNAIATMDEVFCVSFAGNMSYGIHRAREEE